MLDETPYGLLIECRSCGIENNIANFVPSMRIFCSQCRERLVDVEIVETHFEYVCQDCGMRMVFLKSTEVKLGESACSCGSTDIQKVGETTLPDETAKAGGLIDCGEDNDDIMEDADWLRSAGPGEKDGDNFDDDYEDMFNQDPSQY